MNHLNGVLAGLEAEELRAAVRAVLTDVLGEVLPSGVLDNTSGQQPSGHVAISTDADLTAFVRRVAALCEDPQQRAALQDGRHGFRLAGPTGGEPTEHGRARVTRIDRGAVTERAVVKAAADGGRLLLGRGAVLTPLARDKARALGVEIEKER